MAYGADDVVEYSTPQVVGHDDAVEGALAEGPAASLFEVGLVFLQRRMQEPTELTEISIEREHRVLRFEEPVAVPAIARRDIEHATPRADQRREAHHPARWLEMLRIAR